NKSKIEAMKRILKKYKYDIRIITPGDIGFDKEIIENGKTFEENSEIKAREIKRYCDSNNIENIIIITDDAGLCVEKLNGEPGIYTARYAGENPTQLENINKLLDNLKPYTDMEDRSCKLVCVLTAILPSGKIIVSRGESAGSIALKPGKLGGLTYSPVFIPKGFDKPMGEMEEKEYLAVSNHRDVAMHELMKKIIENGDIQFAQKDCNYRQNGV
ncbi:MAG: hypothetical protein K6D97_07225, partial [Clostridia bacterium]|nr:hypothetical protein [Clostridia bacterium]